MHVVSGATPKLNRPSFSVDGQLAPKLDNYEITKMMNRSNFTLFLGKPGSGKTSMIVSMLNTASLFKGVYHNIFLFMGKNSRDSIKNSFFETEVPPECIFDELDFASLDSVYETVKRDAEEGYQSLIVMDDCQRSMKDKQVQKLLLHLCNNRRHLRLSIWTANQNYIAIPRTVRMVLTDMFVWKVSKREAQTIFEEAIEQHKDKFDDVLKVVYKDPHDFLYINLNSQRLFSGWAEIIIADK
jgi:hypothetical protein